MNTTDQNQSNTRHQTLKIAVLADLHYLAPSLIADTPDYTEHRNSDRKMYNESDAFLKAALKRLAAQDPDVLMIAGDLTKDGERECHEAIAAILEQFARDTGAQVFAAPGNHDINNPDATNFNTPNGKAVPAERTTPAIFGDLYAPECFGATEVKRFVPPEGKLGCGLSYCVRPKPGFTLIVMDTNRYSADATVRGIDENQTAGIFTPKLEAWVLEQTRAAKAQGDTVIGLGHHGFLPHFSMEPKAMPAYLIPEYERISTALADAGMDGVFTGHMHANDIQKMTTEKGRSFFDIETASLICYPSPARIVTVTRREVDGQIRENFDVHTLIHTDAGTFVNPETDETQTVHDMTAYAKQYGFDTNMLETTAVHNLRKFFKYLKTHPDKKAEYHSKIVNAIDGLLVERLHVQDRRMKKAGIHVSVNSQGIEGALDDVIPKLFSLNPDVRDSLLRRTVGAMSRVDVTDGRTILDYTNYIYQRHLAGLDGTPHEDWALHTRDFLAQGGLTDAYTSIFTELVMALAGDYAQTLSVSKILGADGIQKNLNLIPSDGRTPLVDLSAKRGGRLILAVVKWMLPNLIAKRRKDGALLFRPTCTIADLISDLKRNPLSHFALTHVQKRTARGASDVDPALPFALPPAALAALQKGKDQVTAFVTEFADSMGNDTESDQDNDTQFILNCSPLAGDDWFSFQPKEA